jgi:purine-binding chemotaxis protein CheW
MTNNSVNSPSPTLERLPAPQTARILKLLLFKIGKLNVALPIDSVQKVISNPSVYGSGINPFGVAHLGDREITVLDLHRRFFKQSQFVDASCRCYLILAKNSAGESFGILVGETPTLIDVPLSQIRTLPESYRRADTLEVASHVTIVPQPDASLTVFVLDVDQLIAPV